MSGGHWDYSGSRLEDILETISEDESVKKRWPILQEIFSKFSEQLYQIEHSMDWDLSGDTLMEDDARFDLAAAGVLLDSIFKALPDKLFERGKWATIQNWQALTKSEEFKIMSGNNR